jgi:hypothetical protein
MQEEILMGKSCSCGAYELAEEKQTINSKYNK